MVTHGWIYLFPFIVLSIVGKYLTTKRYIRNVILLLISLFFYFQWEGNRIFIFFIIVSLTYVFSKLLDRNNNILILSIPILLDLLILIFYKYIVFYASGYHGSLPVGLSFYCFQSISYLVDIYRRKIKTYYSLLEVSVYLSFFPKILAGPIEQADTFMNQLRHPAPFQRRICFTGFKIIVWALCCKYVFAEQLGNIVNDYLNDYSLLTTESTVVAAILFSFQIFFDFYAYSILAIGVASLYGIRLSQNFNYPYFSSSFWDFWKRWNVTLTFWFRNYIYIPLGGNRVSLFRWILNIMIVFIISGIWHGTTLNFIIWGFLHGVFYLFERSIIRLVPSKVKHSSVIKVLYSFFVFGIISLLWLIFRIDNIESLISLFNHLCDYSVVDSICYKDWSIIIGISIFLYILKRSKLLEQCIFQTKDTIPFLIKEICILNLIILSWIFFACNGSSNFIYFKF
jgi:D-alanyl-lipoteichoic acid acyltransferase DltB (MBOAT superfamily)